MIIIDKPFVSDFLIKTIKDQNLEIILTNTAMELISDETLNWITEEEAIKKISNNPKTPIYSNSENAIRWIDRNIKKSMLSSQIDYLKNKIKFRELLKIHYPDYFFKAINYSKIDSVLDENFNYPLIIKPAVGFFSLGVHVLEKREEWGNVINLIKQENSEIQNLYPKEVLDTTNYIIEEYINGEEFAVDCYFDSQGKPVVLNILHHVFSSAKDVSDRIYSTSKSIIENNIARVENFLNVIGAMIGLKNFPIHAELRIDEKGKINPIEINPLRFGGWCTTGDLSWYAYGFNSYEYFINGKKPNWNEILKNKQDKKYSIIVLDNNSGIDGKNIDFFDYDLLLTNFKKPLSLRKADFRKFPVFGFVFIETPVNNDEELNQILYSDLKIFIQS